MAPKKSTIVLNVEQFIHDVEQRPAIWNRNFHCNKAFLEQMWDELSDEHKLPSKWLRMHLVRRPVDQKKLKKQKTELNKRQTLYENEHVNDLLHWILFCFFFCSFVFLFVHDFLLEVVLKAKWKGLRDNFRVEYKRIPRLDNGEFRVDPATFESKWIHYYALLFLTEHMRHRIPKNDQDQSYFFNQQSQECEKTIVEPDLTNGLIRQMQDSDDDFDDDDDVDIDQDDHHKQNENVPPAAHTQPINNILSCGATIKTEDARNVLNNFDKEIQDLSKKTADNNKQNFSSPSSSINCNNKEINDNDYVSSLVAPSTTTGALTAFVTPVTSIISFPSLSSISSTSTIPSTLALTTKATATAALVSGNGDVDVTVDSNCRAISPVKVVVSSIGRPPYHSSIAHAAATAFVTATLASIANTNNNNINNNAQKQIQSQHNLTSLPAPSLLQPIVTLPPTLPSAMVLPNTCVATVPSQKIRSVSPPPLYNKAHHPPPSSSSAVLMLSKERVDDFPLNTSICLHTGNNSSHEHLNFTKHSYTNGLINALKLKRPRLSEDSNYNGSSTMDTTTTISTPPLVPEDDDYHYLLSLHPYMKQLTAAQKLRIRTKIQKLIFKELYKEDLEESR